MRRPPRAGSASLGATPRLARTASAVLPQPTAARGGRLGWPPSTAPGRMSGSEAQTAARHPDLPRDSRAELLLRGQDRLPRPVARRGQALVSVAAAAVRQELVSGHREGVLRGQRGAVSRPAHPQAPGLRAASPGGAVELRRRQFRDAGLPAQERNRPTGRHRAGAIDQRALRHRRGPSSGSAGDPAPGHRTAGGGAGGRVRQADPGRAGEAGTGARQP